MSSCTRRAPASARQLQAALHRLDMRRRRPPAPDCCTWPAPLRRPAPVGTTPRRVSASRPMIAPMPPVPAGTASFMKRPRSRTSRTASAKVNAPAATERAVLAQAVARHHVRLDTVLLQHTPGGDADGQQGRLRVVCQLQLLGRTFEAQLAQGKSQGFVGHGEHVPRDRRSFRTESRPMPTCWEPCPGKTKAMRSLAHDVPPDGPRPSRTTAAPHVRPAPKPTQTMRWPSRSRPASTASPRAMGMDAADVLP